MEQLSRAMSTTEKALSAMRRLLGLKLFSCTAVGLAIGICYDGISIPIYFTAYDKDGTSDFTEQISYIEHVFDIIPADKIECLVVDREFGNGKTFKWLNLRKIPYCLRLRENFCVRKCGRKHA